MPVLARIWNQGEPCLVALLSLGAIGLVCTSLVLRLATADDAGSAGTAMDHAGILLVCAIFLSGSALFRDGRHRRADVLLRIFPTDTQRIIESLNILVALVFCAAIAWYGWRTVPALAGSGEASPWTLVESLGLPVGMSLMAARCLVRLWQYLFRFDPATMVLQDDDVPPGSRGRE